MPTPPTQRLAKLLFFTSISAILLSITLFLISTRWTTYYQFSANVASLAPGSIDFTRVEPGRAYLTAPAGFSSTQSQAPLNWLPSGTINSSLWTLSIPLWLPALLFALAALATYRRAFITPGLCRKCNYSLEGLENPERCPECGRQLESSPHPTVAPVPA